jgi:hypothetical protein
VRPEALQMFCEERYKTALVLVRACSPSQLTIKHGAFGVWLTVEIIVDYQHGASIGTVN